jgi:hypothetical protein
MNSTLILATAILLTLCTDALANGHVEETTYSVEAVVRWVVAGFGGLIALTGAVLASLNIRDLATVELSSFRQKVTIKKINQGVVIVLAGVAVLIAGLAFLPDKTHTRIMDGKVIELGPTINETCTKSTEYQAWEESKKKLAPGEISPLPPCRPINVFGTRLAD